MTDRGSTVQLGRLCSLLENLIIKADSVSKSQTSSEVSPGRARRDQVSPSRARETAPSYRLSGADVSYMRGP